MATEDYLRSRRIFKTTSAGNTHDEDSMDVAKGNPARARRVVKRHQSPLGSRVSVEIAESTDTKAVDCWFKQPPTPQGKGKGTGKSKPKVTEISESDNSKHVDYWNPSSNTHSSQIYLK